MMFAESEPQISLPLTSSAAASPAKTCPARERALALLESARACGVSSLVWSERFDRDGSLSRTSRAVLDGGSTRSCVSWSSSAMRAYRSRSRRAMSALLTSETACSLLPTLTVCQRDNRGGENPSGPVRPSLETLARAGVLPTLTVAGNYNRKGASPNSGDGLRTALLPTLLASAEDKGGTTYGRGNLTLRGSLQLLPTLTTRDEKGPGPAHTGGGADLPQALGGHLSPAWCLWFMGFPADWLDVDDAHVFARSGTRSYRSALKSSAG